MIPRSRRSITSWPLNGAASKSAMTSAPKAARNTKRSAWRPPLQDVVARAAEQHVVADPAAQHVVAAAALQGVAAAVAHQHVAGGTAPQHVAACPALQQVVAAAADKRVGAIPFRSASPPPDRRRASPRAAS